MDESDVKRIKQAVDSFSTGIYIDSTNHTRSELAGVSKSGEAGDEYRAEEGKSISSEEQVQLLLLLLKLEATPEGEPVSKKEVRKAIEDSETEFNFRLETLLKNLQAKGLIETVKSSGPDWWVINKRTDEIVVGNLESALNEEWQRLQNVIDTNEEVRRVVEGELETRIEERSFEDTMSKRDLLNRAVEALEEAGFEESEEIGEIVFVRNSAKYRVTGRIKELLEDVE